MNSRLDENHYQFFIVEFSKGNEIHAWNFTIYMLIKISLGPRRVEQGWAGLVPDRNLPRHSTLQGQGWKVPPGEDPRHSGTGKSLTVFKLWGHETTP